MIRIHSFLGTKSEKIRGPQEKKLTIQKRCLLDSTIFFPHGLLLFCSPQSMCVRNDKSRSLSINTSRVSGAYVSYAHNNQH